MIFLSITQQLLSNLHGQIDVCRQYLRIQNIKKETIVSGDIPKLDEIVKQEQTIIMKLDSLDNKRISLLSKAGLEDKSLAEIASDYVELEYRQQFNEAVDDLTAVINKIKKSIFLNQRLLKQRLSVVDKVLKVIEETPRAKKPTGKPFMNFIKRA